MELHPYPTDFGVAVAKVIKHLRGTELMPHVELLHAGWHVAGVALSYADPHPRPPIVGMSMPTSDEAIALALEGCCTPKTSVPGTPEALPWGTIATIVLELLSRWLRK
jgi:hypothetical protein